MALKTSAKTTVLVEAACFALILAFIWLDECFDFPHLFLKMPPSPISWADALFESAITLALGAIVVFTTLKMSSKKGKEEKVVLICAVCRKVSKDGRWMSLDDFIAESSSGTFAHGICPDCMDTYYKGVTDTTALNFKQFLKYRKQD